MFELGNRMETEFQKIRQALEEHLGAINENTHEIQSLFDFLQEMEVKLEKFSQRLDQMQLNASTSGAPAKPAVTPLNQMEKKVFLVLYTEETALGYREIAEKAHIPVSVVPECLSCLANKGIPLARTFCNEQLFFQIEPTFKEVQARENVINLSLQSFME